MRIIRDNGDAGLTMRKIADCAGMRLSNVQYYFKSRDDVLAAMVTLYFGQCESELRQAAESSKSLGRRERTHRLILNVLHHGVEISDMCRVFRELWAISTRNDVVRSEMGSYYETLCSVLAKSILGDDGSAELEHKVGSFLLPYVEGYSITAPSLPMPMEQVATMLTDLTLRILEGD